jgi:hypothetical protein
VPYSHEKGAEEMPSQEVSTETSFDHLYPYEGVLLGWLRAGVSDLNLNVTCIATGINKKTDFPELPTCVECVTNLHEER